MSPFSLWPLLHTSSSQECSANKVGPVYPGGVCNEPNGRGGTVGIPNQEWQRWRIVWDRTSGDWRSQTITWFMNSQQFHQVRGDQIGDANVWASLTAKPLFFILNVAVGGDWVGTSLSVYN